MGDIQRAIDVGADYIPVGIRTAYHAAVRLLKENYYKDEPKTQTLEERPSQEQSPEFTDEMLDKLKELIGHARASGLSDSMMGISAHKDRVVDEFVTKWWKVRDPDRRRLTSQEVLEKLKTLKK